MAGDKYAAQKKYLASGAKKQMCVWVDAEKYAQFKAAVHDDGKSMYGLINEYIDEYLKNRE